MTRIASWFLAAALCISPVIRSTVIRSTNKRPTSTPQLQEAP